MVYAGFWRRFAAVLIDFLILLIPSVVISWILPYVGAFVLAILYRPFFEASELMGTPGKAFMGLVVTTEAGERISFKQSMLRYVLSILSGAVLCIGYLFNLFTPKRQTFHDLMAGTVVLRRDVSTDVDWIGIWTREFKSVFNVGENSFSGASESSPASMPSTPPSNVSAMQTLEALHKLFQQGAISEAEYNAKKEELLKKI